MRKGTGTSDEPHPEGEPDRLRGPRHVRGVATGGHRARPVGIPDPDGPDGAPPAGRPRQEGGTGLPHPGPAPRAEHGQAQVTACARQPALISRPASLAGAHSSWPPPPSSPVVTVVVA